MEFFCEKCGVILEQGEEQTLKIKKPEKNLQYCFECAGWIKLAKLFENQPEPADLEF